MIGLRWWRRARGWTQAELAARSGVERSHLAKIERGEVGEPRPATLRRLAGTLGVEPFDLLVGRDALDFFGAPEVFVRGGNRIFPSSSPENRNKAHEAPPSHPQTPTGGGG